MGTGGLGAPGLSFTEIPGPLLLVAGLCGGAGASTLAYLIAATAALQSTRPVLVCDTGGPTAGLALYAGVRSPRTLCAASETLAAGQPLTGGLYTPTPGGLRVIAGDPQFTVPGDREGLRRILTDARAAHALTVVDAGTLARPADQTALALATHIAWVLPATPGAVGRARRVLQRVAQPARTQLIIARAQQTRPPVGALQDIAEDRRAPLILLPHLQSAEQGLGAVAIEEAALSLQAIGGVLRR
jgi:Flp pilus assembly CpaE family ATPase